jgi:hypothetical protein
MMATARRATTTNNKRDGGGRGEKRRRHEDELEAVAAELAWRPAVAAAVAAARIASIFGEKRPILCVTEKKHQKSNPHIGTGTPRIGLQIGESQNRFGVHSNFGTNISYLLQKKCNIISAGSKDQVNSI